jgi:hypothetical protein
MAQEYVQEKQIQTWYDDLLGELIGEMNMVQF